MNTQWNFIQTLRGIAISGVLLFHSGFIARKYFNGVLNPSLLLDYGKAGVDLFFVISGFIMVTVTRNKFGALNQSFKFVIARTSRIYPTYWVYFFITLVIYLTNPKLVNSSVGNHANLISSFFLLPSEQLPLVMVGWSLIHELWFYFVFSFLLLTSEKNLLPCLLVWASLIIFINSISSNPSSSPYIRLIIHPYSLEFILGSITAISLRPFIIKSPISPLLILSCSLASICGLAYIFNHRILLHEDIERCIVVGGTFSLLSFSLALIELKGKLKFSGLLNWLGGISYTIYLSHILVLSGMGRTLNLVVQNSYLGFYPLVIWLLLFISVIFYGWLGYKYMEQPLIKFSRQLRDLI